MNAFRDLSQTEGIIPPSKSLARHCGAYKAAADPESQRGYDKAVMIVNISGRGDKDMATAGKWFGYPDRRSGRRALMWPAPTAILSPEQRRGDFDYDQ